MEKSLEDIIKIIFLTMVYLMKKDIFIQEKNFLHSTIKKIKFHYQSAKIFGLPR